MRKNIYFRLCELKYLLSTLRFNYHYFGWRGLWIRPIVFYSPVKLRDMKGRIILNCSMRHALISIGLPGNEMFPYNIPNIWSDQGGEIIFDGSFGTNPGASFVIRKGAVLHIGCHSSFGQNLKILCSKEIHLGAELLASWDITIMDTDSHYFLNCKTGDLSEFSKSIHIGKHCFIGSACTLLKGCNLPNGSVVASRALITSCFNQEKALYAGIPAKLIKLDITYHH